VPVHDDVYAAYHDLEWGLPVRDERSLFELLCLEGAQAGLSWRTILGRRDGYRAVFDGFDPERIAAFDDDRLETILQDTRIVRNRLKVYAARDNARTLLRLRAEREDGLAGILWAAVGGRPIQNAWQSLTDVPAVTPEAETLSLTLRKFGFRFVGPTICYALMQSAGLVNDHVVTCYRYSEVQDSSRPLRARAPLHSAS
jgi:DNA-3-methyladenine glycosylase I